MEIANWKKESFIDYPGKTSVVVFTPKCNYKCPACHAKVILNSKERVSQQEIFNYIDSRKQWIDSVVICGGESTLEPDLLDFIVRAKDRGLAVKLDTNGSNPSVLKELLEQKTIDYVAMDIKAPTYFYPQVIGRDFDFRRDLQEGIRIVSKFPDYEFRTTIAPIIRDNKITWMSPLDIGNISWLIYSATGNDKHKYFLQKFVARSKDEMLDERFAKENLPKKMHETPTDYLEECLKEAKKYLTPCNKR